MVNKIEKIPVPDNLENELMTDDELEVKNNYFPILNRLDLIQDKYFIYDHSNFAKKSFITELNKSISIYSSITYFNEKKN